MDPLGGLGVGFKAWEDKSVSSHGTFVPELTWCRFGRQPGEISGGHMVPNIE